MKFTTIHRFIPVAIILLFTASGCGARLGASSSALAGVSISPNTFTKAGTATITLTMTSRSGGIRYVTLKSSSSAVVVPIKCGVWTNDSSDQCNQQATISAVTSPQTVTITATYNGVSKTVTVTLNPGSTQSPTLTIVSCGNASITGAGTDTCQVDLSGAATAATAVTLSSSSGSLKVPASVTVPVGASSATFTATATAVTTQTIATITASLAGNTATTTVTLKPSVVATPVLTDSSNAVAFGDVTIGNSAEGTVTLYASGATVTITSITSPGNGFTVTGVTAGQTIAAGATGVLDITFTPTVAAAETATVKIVSNGGTLTVSFTGTGQVATVNYQVDLTWDVPSGSPVPITGYYIYRSASGGSFELLTASAVSNTTYTNSTVLNGVTYNYEVTSGDSAGVQSVPSNVFTVSIE